MLEGSLEKAKAAIEDMPQRRVTELVKKRLNRQSVCVLPPLRDENENLSAILIDLADEQKTDQEVARKIRRAATNIINAWAKLTDKTITTRSAPVSELLYMLGQIHATEAIPPVTRFTQSDSLGQVLSPWSESLPKVASTTLSRLQKP